MKHRPALSILIVNWNSVRFLERCLTTIEEHVRTLAYEVVVVDNASHDGCAEMLARRFPRTRFVQAGTNLGFARGNNLAFAEAQADTVLFLNPDTELTDDAIEVMFDHLTSDEQAGAAGCRVLNPDGTVQWVYTQALPTIANQILGADVLRRLFPRSALWGLAPILDAGDAPVDAQVLAGSCLMVKRAVFERVGGFDARYYMYSDDVDLCYKIHQAGYDVRYIGSRNIVHHGGTSAAFRGESHFAAVMQKESLAKFFEGTRGTRYAAAYRVAIGTAAFIRLTLIAAMLPAAAVWPGTARLRGTARKWWSVLRWSLGLESWAASAGQPAPSAT